MYRRILLLLVAIAWVGMACEAPKSPDFSTQLRVDIPVIEDRSYQLLGSGEDVLIDTTGTEFDSLFVVDTTSGDFNSFLSIATTENFDFGDLDDAIPEVNVDETSFNAEVGELSIDDFSSESGPSSNLGEASFQELTGLDPAFVPANTPIPGNSSPAPVNINVTTDFFESATFKPGGTLSLTLTNTLGFNIDQLNLVIFSGDPDAGGVQVGPIVFSNFEHNTERSEGFIFTDPNGTELGDIHVQLTVSWSAQTTQANPGSITVNDVAGESLVAESIRAKIEPQDFSTNGSTDFSRDEFLFQSPNHFVQLSAGQLNVLNIVNEIDIAIDSLIISFPGIILDEDGNGDYPAQDSLVLEFVGPTAISGNSSGGSLIRDLAGARIFAVNNIIEYNIVAKTEDTQDNTVTPEISENDEVSATVRIDNIVLDLVQGIVVEQTVLLNDDEFEDEVLDLQNDNEAEVIEIDGLEDFSEQIDGINFADPQLTLIYTTNIGVETEIIGAFLGETADGEIFLSAVPGEALEVDPLDDISGLVNNGIQVPRENLIKFSLTPGLGGLIRTDQVVFNTTTTNVDDFLNELPSTIRFVGKTLINQGSTAEGSIGNPVVFDSEINVDLPVAFSVGVDATFEDSVELDLEDTLPEESDDLNYEEATVFINYVNGLPLGVDLLIDFLGEDGSTLFSAPISGESIILTAAPVDANGFATSSPEQAIRFRLSESELDNLEETKDLRISAVLATDQTGEVIRLKATDTIRLGLSISIVAEASVN